MPNREKYPDFYFSKYRDSMHMMLEPLLLFETVLIENQPITQLIDSDFTYRSRLLEEAYEELGNEPKMGKRKVAVRCHGFEFQSRAGHRSSQRRRDHQCGGHDDDFRPGANSTDHSRGLDCRCDFQQPA